MLLLAFVLYLSGDKHHIDGASVFHEDTLTIWQNALIKVHYGAVQQDPSKNLAGCAEQGYACVIVANMSFVEMDDGDIFEVLGCAFLIPHDSEELGQFI